MKPFEAALSTLNTALGNDCQVTCFAGAFTIYRLSDILLVRDSLLIVLMK